MATNGTYVGYYRVSTDRQGRSGLGLEAQRAAVAGYLDGGNWTLLDTFTEVESGRRNDRPELARCCRQIRLLTRQECQQASLPYGGACWRVGCVAGCPYGVSAVPQISPILDQR